MSISAIALHWSPTIPLYNGTSHRDNEGDRGQENHSFHSVHHDRLDDMVR
jgi:hypothetical protein